MSTNKIPLGRHATPAELRDLAKLVQQRHRTAMAATISGLADLAERMLAKGDVEAGLVLNAAEFLADSVLETA